MFFTCDHGEFTGSHRLHDKGPAMYEDIYRTPGIVRIPGTPSGSYHWMTTMYDVGQVDHDPTQSGLDETTYRSTEAEVHVA